MSEVVYELVKEETEELKPTVLFNEMNTIMHQLNSGKIPRSVAISKIYLENREKPAKKGK